MPPFGRGQPSLVEPEETSAWWTQERCYPSLPADSNKLARRRGYGSYFGLRALSVAWISLSETTPESTVAPVREMV